MPESVLFEKILPGGKLTSEEWLSLIYERARLVNISMDRVRLTKLSDFGYSPSDLGGGCTVSINGLRDKRTVVGEGSDIHIEGIFRIIQVRGDADSRKHYVLGFSRTACWYVAEIFEDSVDYRRYIRSLDVWRTDLGDVINRFHIDYRQILAFLAMEHDGWVEKKRDVLERMLRIQAQIVRDDLILDALCAEPKEQGR